MHATPAPTGVLLVEDEAGDVQLVREALRESGLQNDVSVVGDGEAALRYLRRAGEFADVARPDIVLLDLNLPRRGGLEVLAEIKADEDLKSIPVIILTTSEAAQDVQRAYEGYANAFITKPVDFDAFTEVIRRIDAFYVQTVRLPKRS